MDLTRTNPLTKVIPMNTYTTFSITTKTTPNRLGKPHYEAVVLGNGQEMETFSGCSMREALALAAEFIGAVIDLYCEECSYIVEPDEETFRLCGLCPVCYDKMIARKEGN